MILLVLLVALLAPVPEACEGDSLPAALGEHLAASWRAR